MVDEKALLERARAGDREAFDRLVRGQFPRVYAVAFRMLGNHEDAEDLAQECFVRAHRSLAWYRGEGAFSSWLFRIVVHLARDRFRRIERRPKEGGWMASLEPAAPRGPSQELHGKELQRVLVDAIQELPERLRTPLVLRTLEGFDYADVADATGVTPNTARTQVMKARRALIRILRPFLDEGSP